MFPCISHQPGIALLGGYQAACCLVADDHAGTHHERRSHATAVMLLLCLMHIVCIASCFIPAGCERIQKTPIPAAYTRHTSRFLMIYCVFSPIALWPSVSWVGAAPDISCTWMDDGMTV